MLLAAGLGTRLRPFTHILPKPAIEFLGIPMIYYPLIWLNELNIKSFVINTHYLPDKIESIMAPLKMNVQFSHEAPEILGTGGAIWKAKPHFNLQYDLIVINGDTIYLPQNKNFLLDVLKAHHKSKALATLVVMEFPGVGKNFGGVWSNQQGQIQSLGKEIPPNSHELKAWHFTGVRIFSPRIFDYLPEGASHIFDDVLIPAIKQGESVMTYVHQAPWFETGDLTSYLKASEEVLQLLTNNQSSILLETMNQFNCNYNLKKHPLRLLGENSVIENNFKQEGFVITGRNVKIGSNCHLKNVVISSNHKIDNEQNLLQTIIV